MENQMRQIRLSMVTLNIGAGQAGEKVEKAKKLLEKVSGKNAVITKGRKRSTFGVSRGRPIGAKATVRGSDATALLKRLLEATGNKLKASQFDRQGSFSFGIRAYIDIPGVKYDPALGIMGMDVAVTLRRPGFRVATRRLKQQRIGKTHRITPADAIAWTQKNFGVTVE